MTKREENTVGIPRCIMSYPDHRPWDRDGLAIRDSMVGPFISHLEGGARRGKITKGSQRSRNGRAVHSHTRHRGKHEDVGKMIVEVKYFSPSSLLHKAALVANAVS